MFLVKRDIFHHGALRGFASVYFHRYSSLKRLSATLWSFARRRTVDKSYRSVIGHVQIYSTDTRYSRTLLLDLVTSTKSHRGGCRN